MFRQQRSVRLEKPAVYFLLLLGLAAGVFSRRSFAASLSLSPSSGAGGALITASSGGFHDEYDTGFYADGGFQTSCGAVVGNTSDKRGNCSVQFRAPYAVGPHTIRAFNSVSEEATQPFTVVSPIFRISPTCGPAGTRVTAHGHLFGIGLDAGIYFDGSYVGADQYPNESGDFEITFTMPGGSEGPHTISARNSGGSDVSTVFTITTNCATVATVTDSSGGLQVLQPDGTWRNVGPGDSLDQNDTVRTLGNGNATLNFPDDSQLLLPPNTKVVLDQYVYSPDNHDGFTRNSVLSGAFEYISGLLGTHASEDNKGIDTPMGVIGIRGTEFVSRNVPCSQTQEVYLIHGQLSITPYDTGLRSVFDAPITILFTSSNITTSALSQATYDAVKNEIFQTNASVTFPAWQIQYFGCTNNLSASPAADPDGDGENNLAEFLAGTDPTSSASAFRLLSVAPAGNDMRVTWMCGSGRTNVLQSTTRLDGSWSNVSPNISLLGTGDVVTNYLDSGALTNTSAKYYRVRLVSP